MGAWNHGLMQDIKLLRIGCGYPPARSAATRCAGGRPPSPSSPTRSSRTRSGPPSTPQGAVNEQATLYENFVYTLWQTALPELAACGYQLPGWITARIAQLPAFPRVRHRA